jgi:putative Holliday junction resolvase
MSPLIGIDYGLRRIGIAVSDASDTLASAVGTHREDRDGSILARLRELVADRGITGIVVGWPVTAAGEEGDIARRARRFAERLRSELGLPVTLLDERYSSQEAQRRLRATGRRQPREAIDALAAELILQVHLDRLRARPEEET